MTEREGSSREAGGLVEIVTTVATDEDAAAMAREAVAARVAACATWAPVRSAYRWEGRVVEEDERLLVLKTTEAVAPRAEAWILARHPYETPAVLRQAILAASPAYAAWVRESVSDPAVDA